MHIDFCKLHSDDRECHRSFCNTFAGCEYTRGAGQQHMVDFSDANHHGFHHKPVGIRKNFACITYRFCCRFSVLFTQTILQVNTFTDKIHNLSNMYFKSHNTVKFLQVSAALPATVLLYRFYLSKPAGKIHSISTTCAF